jgi:hypothetical protein
MAYNPALNLTRLGWLILFVIHSLSPAQSGKLALRYTSICLFHYCRWKTASTFVFNYIKPNAVFSVRAGSHKYMSWLFKSVQIMFFGGINFHFFSIYVPLCH